MIVSVIEECPKDWQVWIALERGRPDCQPHSFICGCGETRDDAVRAAVAELEEAIDVLQRPPADAGQAT